MKFLALEHELPTATNVQFQPHLRAEAARVWELYQAGVLREVYYRADRPLAVLMLECASADEARQALRSLPLVAAGLIDFELIPLRPYSGFARRFGESP